MKERGYTLADAISLGIILIILGLIAVPHVKAGRSRAREVQVRTNMHTLQLTAEDFATLANGRYPNNLDIEVEEACIPCAGDNRNIADNYIAPFGANALLPDNLKNPFNASANAIFDAAGMLSGRVNYWDFDSRVNAAGGYSIRGVGVDDTRYLTLVMTSSR